MQTDQRIPGLLFLLTLPVSFCGSWGNFWTNGSNSDANDNQRTIRDLVVWARPVENRLAWSPEANATAYNIYWRTTPGVTPANGTKITTSVSPYAHTGLANGTAYYYIVTLVISGKEGPPSAEQTSTPYVACTNCRMFITATSHTPGTTFTGIANADSQCQTQATGLALPGQYRAVLVDGVRRRACQTSNCAINGINEQIDWVLHPTTSYVRSDGATGLFISNIVGLGSSMSTTFDGSGNPYWTGLSPAWSWVTASTCAAWSDSGAVAQGSYGVGSWTDDRAFAITALAACNTPGQRLLCVQIN